MPQALLNVIQSRVLLCDGAMGTQLQQAGLEAGGCGEAWNVDHPERVKAIQQRYRDAGSDLIITNTFGGCRITLARHDQQGRAAELNEAGARVAREVMGAGRWVIGDIGPFGGIMAPLGDVEPEDVAAAFLEQARALVRGGVDAIIVETQTALEELELGVEAAKRAIGEAGKTGQIAVIGSMAYDRTKSGPPRTMMGVTPAAAAEKMAALGVDIIAANCGTKIGITEYADIVRLYSEAVPGKPLMAQPNAGMPEIIDDKIVYHETPEMMAAGLQALVDAGARIVGGCCGTTPEHIRHFRREVDRINGGR